MAQRYFEITEQEWRSGSLASNKLEKVQESFDSIGFAVVTGLVPPKVCEQLTVAFLEDVELIREKAGLTRHEKHTAVGHLQLGPRRCSPYVHKEMVANPILESIVAKLLGPKAWLGFYNGNVNCPGSGYQPLHFDRPYAWKTEQAAKRRGSLGLRIARRFLARWRYQRLLRLQVQQKYIQVVSARRMSLPGAKVSNQFIIHRSLQNGIRRRQ